MEGHERARLLVWLSPSRLVEGAQELRCFHSSGVKSASDIRLTSSSCTPVSMWDIFTLLIEHFQSREKRLHENVEEV